jgi:hypothetical protein
MLALLPSQAIQSATKSPPLPGWAIRLVAILPSATTTAWKRGLKQSHRRRGEPPHVLVHYPWHERALQQGPAEDRMSDPIATVDEPGWEGAPRILAHATPSPERIGRYRIERVLGQGGFGLVFLAHDDQLSRLVAIKVPHARLLAGPAMPKPI